MDYINEGYLSHHGVKGMKWGVRRYQNEDGTLKNPKGRRKSGSKTWKASEGEYLSDEELDKRNSRLSKENKYRENIKNAHPRRKEAEQLARTIFVATAATIAATVVTKKYQQGAAFVMKMAKHHIKMPAAVHEVKSKVMRWAIGGS